VWRGTECIATLEGHEGPVLSLAVTREGDILSGSGDTTIRRWAGGKCVQTYKGHTDTVRCVRGIAMEAEEARGPRTTHHLALHAPAVMALESLA
jgi:WD40 repeat protein